MDLRRKYTALRQCRASSQHLFLKKATLLQPETMRMTCLLSLLLLLLLDPGNLLLARAGTPEGVGKFTFHLVWLILLGLVPVEYIENRVRD